MIEPFKLFRVGLSCWALSHQPVCPGNIGGGLDRACQRPRDGGLADALALAMPQAGAGHRGAAGRSGIIR
jgi:hypothetical protein